MRPRRKIWIGTLLVAAASALGALAQAPRAAALITLFEGARLIAGDGGRPIENSAFLVENDRFTRIGAKGHLQAPRGARRVDLSGKTVMPALVDAHVHVGYRKGLTFTADNYTPENLLDELDRFAYYGLAAILEAGTPPRAPPFPVRGEARSRAPDLPARRGFALAKAGARAPMR